MWSPLVDFVWLKPACSKLKAANQSLIKSSNASAWHSTIKLLGCLFLSFFFVVEIFAKSRFLLFG